MARSSSRFTYTNNVSYTECTTVNTNFQFVVDVFSRRSVLNSILIISDVVVET